MLMLLDASEELGWRVFGVVSFPCQKFLLITTKLVGFLSWSQ